MRPRTHGPTKSACFCGTNFPTSLFAVAASKVNELGGLEQKHESELLGKSNRLRIYFAEKAAEKVAEKEEAHVKDLAGLFEWNMKI